ncbi:VOC family protein [Roseicitreum antarcticum]|uniref:VOC domain-containing protein n=1 Tax=Roseicitreum antarcticum TaxID=564137 RepID=A0A1H3EHJ8_9RHOB|nr:VOC family protein [Roseicitreum antarcticum]SDX78090.1 hypothetical protein SAMN04488238_12124 [Roseicitreum antarcticum]
MNTNSDHALNNNMRSGFALILHSEHPESCAAFYSFIGFSFMPEQHGDGPLHFAAQDGNFLLEIYPGVSRAQGDAIFAIAVADIAKCAELAEATGHKIKSPPTIQGGVKRMIFYDPDGRSVMVYQI